MKIMISGATGFLGAHLIRHFSQKGHEILALGRQLNPPKKLLDFAKYKVVDISHFVPKMEADICIHTAGLASDYATSKALFKVNVEGTKRVFESINCAHFIHISSASVYDGNKTYCSENQSNISTELSEYGRSKKAAEEFLLKQKASKKITILRPRAIYGIGDRVLLPRILNLVKMGRVVVPGDLDIKVSLTHIQNLTSAIEKAIKLRTEKSCKIFNVCDPKTYHLKTIVSDLVESAYGRSIPVFAIPLSFAHGLAKMKLSPKLTKQGIDYVSKSCVLGLMKIDYELGYQDSELTNFHESLPNLSKWIAKVGLKNILKGERNLPWMSIENSASINSPLFTPQYQ